MGRTKLALMAAMLMLFAWAAPLGRCAIADRRAIVVDDVEYEDGQLTSTMRDWSKRMKPIPASDARGRNDSTVAPPAGSSFADYWWAFALCGMGIVILSICVLLYFILRGERGTTEDSAEKKDGTAITTITI